MEDVVDVFVDNGIVVQMTASGRMSLDLVRKRLSSFEVTLGAMKLDPSMLLGDD